MNNSKFLDVLKSSFSKFLETGSRSNQKLKILHGAIANDLSSKLNMPNNEYTVNALNFGKERNIVGRYIDKNVDITISKDGAPIAGVGIKFVMGNYKQNSNNYFENMLGETANLRSNNIPYFQIFIVPDKLPYYNKHALITKWEAISEHNLKKYMVMSQDNTDVYLHTPNKTLIAIINLSECTEAKLTCRSSYINHYQHKPFSVTLSPKQFNFGRNVVYNDYETFIRKVVYAILSI